MRGVRSGLIAIVAMVGCGLGGPSVPMPTGPLELLPGAPEPDGEVTVAATGVGSGVGWRLLAWQSGDLLCRQLDLVAVSNLDCGPPQDDDPFISVTVGADLGGVGAIHGFVDERVESVSARADDGTPYDVPVIRSGLAGSAAGLFVILYPSTESIVSITAYGADGAALKLRDVR